MRRQLVGQRMLAAQLALLAAGLVLLALQWVAGPPELRAALTLIVLATGPGSALVGWFRLDDAWTTASLAIALSFAVDVLVAQVMLWTGVWSPTGALVAIVSFMAVGTGSRAAFVALDGRRVRSSREATR